MEGKEKGAAPEGTNIEAIPVPAQKQPKTPGNPRVNPAHSGTVTINVRSGDKKCHFSKNVTINVTVI
jgi:hypothetical protein